LGVTKPVRMLSTSAIDVPTVIGWWRPAVLVPVSACLQLSPAQLEAVLAHELAHIRRHDYLVNALQNVVETVLFYHPAVWWLSGRIREEREQCCDDLAVSVCEDRVMYARALVLLEESRQQSPAFGLAATGGSLLTRVHRLLGTPRPRPRAPLALVLCTLSLVVSAIVGARSDAESVSPVRNATAHPARGVDARDTPLVQESLSPASRVQPQPRVSASAAQTVDRNTAEQLEKRLLAFFNFIHCPILSAGCRSAHGGNESIRYKPLLPFGAFANNFSTSARMTSAPAKSMLPTRCHWITPF